MSLIFIFGPFGDLMLSTLFLLIFALAGSFIFFSAGNFSLVSSASFDSWTSKI